MGFAQNGNIKIWTEIFGDKNNPAILLVIGAGAVSSLFPDDFCKDLANAGYFVVRYDQRDYGRSTHFPTVSQEVVNETAKTHDPTKLPYTMNDLEEDAIAVLDHHDIQLAHVLGYSTGGLIAQMVAILHPNRVLSITSLGVGPITRKVSLSPIPQETWDAILNNMPTGNYEKDLPGWLKSFRYLHATYYPFDEARAKSYVKDIYKYEPNPTVAWNHIAIQHAAHDYYDELRALKVPTLVIHGENDKLQLLEYGKATADLIPEAKLEVILGAGHMFFNKKIWDQIAKVFIAHIKTV